MVNEEKIWQLRFKVSQLPTQIWHRRGEKYLEYEYENPLTDDKERVAWCDGTIIHMGTSKGIDVYDESGEWRRDTKLYSSTGPSVPHILRIQSDNSAELPFREIRMSKDLHSKIISNETFSPPLFDSRLNLVFYLAERTTPSPPKSLADLATTEAYNYSTSIETYGEGVDTTQPLPYIIDIAAERAYPIDISSLQYAVKKILPVPITDPKRLQLVLSCIPKGGRKLGTRFCMNRPTTLLLIDLDPTAEYKTLSHHTLLTVPYEKDEHHIASITSPLILKSDDRSSIRLGFFGTEHAGEHMSDVSFYRAVWSRKETSEIELVNLERHSPKDAQILFIPSELRCSVVNRQLAIRHLPNEYTFLDQSGTLIETISSSDVHSLTTNFTWNTSELQLCCKQSLLEPKRLMKFQNAQMTELSAEAMNLPQLSFPNVSKQYRVYTQPLQEGESSSDIVIRRLMSDSKEEFAPAHKVFLWIHGGPNSRSCAQFFSPLLTFLLEIVQVDLLLLPNYTGSLTDKGMYNLAGNIGSRDVEDCIDLLNRWINLEDPGEQVSVVVGGASHGGFVTGHLMAHHLLQKCLRGGIIWNGVLDLVYTYASSDIPDWSIYQSTGSLCESPCAILTDGEQKLPEDWLTKLYSQSPISKVDQVRWPVCILIGLKDQRVPPAQSLRYAEKLGKKLCKLYTYPQDGHALSTPSSAFHRDLQIVNFLLCDVGWPAHADYS